MDLRGYVLQMREVAARRMAERGLELREGFVSAGDIFESDHRLSPAEEAYIRDVQLGQAFQQAVYCCLPGKPEFLPPFKRGKKLVYAWRIDVPLDLAWVLPGNIFDPNRLLQEA